MTVVTFGDGSKMGLAVAQIVGHTLGHLDGWPEAAEDASRPFGCCITCCTACAGLKTLHDKGVLDDAPPGADDV